MLTLNISSALEDVNINSTLYKLFKQNKLFKSNNVFYQGRLLIRDSVVLYYYYYNAQFLTSDPYILY